MRNNVLQAPDEPGPGSDPRRMLERTVERGLETRRAAAEAEIRALIAATFRVIERTGSLSPRVSEIVSEAGLSNQAFYRHFRGKHELLVAVLDEGIRGLADYLARRMREASTPEAAVRAWIRGMAAQARDPLGARATRPFARARGRLAEEFPQEVARSEAQLTAPLRQVLMAARDSGTLPAVDPECEAEALYHLMMGWVEARLIEGRTPTEAEVATLEALILAGLGRPAEVHP